MSRILTKGSRAGIEDNHADWDEQENLKNHHIAFYDLVNLENRKQEFSQPWLDCDNVVSLPSRYDVTQFLFGGNDIVIRLPKVKKTKLPGENRDGEEEWYDFDLFAWLPFTVVLNDEENGGDLIEILADSESWSVYFDEGSEWSVVIQSVRQQPWYSSTPYSDPRPSLKKNIGGKDVLVQQPETMATPTQADMGPEVIEEVIAVDNVNRTIATKVSLTAKDEDGQIMQSEGSVYLIPPHPSKQFDHFVQEILQTIFNEDVESAPEWVSQYPIVGEEQVREKIAKLEERLSEVENKVEKGEWYRQLLFANDGDDTEYELEKPVREAFREVGLAVDGEKPGFRDGGIQLDDQTFVLEITGRSGGVSIGKIQKLKRHVNDAADENYGDNLTGLLVYNPFRNEDPESRSLNTQNFVDELEERNFKLITTYQVYQMVSQYKRDEIGTDDIVTKIKGDETVIEFSGSVKKDGMGLRDRIKSAQYRLANLFI